MTEYEIIALFCHLDDFCKNHQVQDPRQKMSDSEVMFSAITAARMFGGNLSKACLFLKEQNYCPKMLSCSRFNRRMHQIPEHFWIESMRIFCPTQKTQEYIVDSFPISTCRMARRYRCNLFYGDHFLGYNASHKQWFMGLKIHLLITTAANPLSLIISPGSEHDLTGLKLMEMPIPAGSIIYGDKAYTDYEWEERLEKESGVQLVPERKTNMKKQHPEVLEKQRAKVRKMVETAISGIVRLMPRWIQAVTEKGFELKLTLFVIAFASMQLAT